MNILFFKYSRKKNYSEDARQNHAVLTEVEAISVYQQQILYYTICIHLIAFTDQLTLRFII